MKKKHKHDKLIFLNPTNDIYLIELIIRKKNIEFFFVLDI